MPTPRCGCCRKFLSPVECVKCAKCGLSYHRLCVTLAAKGKIALTWRCPVCEKKESNDTSLHDRSISTQNIEKQEDDSSPYKSPELHTTTKQGCDNTKDFTIRHVMEELRAMRIDYLDFRKEISDLKIMVQSYNTRMDELEARMESIEQRIIEMEEPVDYDSVIQQLKDDFNDQEQDSFQNDLEIRNIPEEESENRKQLVTLVAAKLGVHIVEQDIVRGTIYINPSISGEMKKPQRPRANVVRLARRDIRDAVLHNARVQRTTYTSDLGISEKSYRFYVNERLTRTNNQLFRLAREVGRQNGWQFIWTKRGRLLARRKPGDPVLRVRHGKDVNDNIGRCAYTF